MSFIMVTDLDKFRLGRVGLGGAIYIINSNFQN